MCLATRGYLVNYIKSLYKAFGVKKKINGIIIRNSHRIFSFLFYIPKNEHNAWYWLKMIIKSFPDVVLGAGVENFWTLRHTNFLIHQLKSARDYLRIQNISYTNYLISLEILVIGELINNLTRGSHRNKLSLQCKQNQLMKAQILCFGEVGIGPKQVEIGDFIKPYNHIRYEEPIRNRWEVRLCNVIDR